MENEELKKEDLAQEPCQKEEKPKKKCSKKQEEIEKALAEAEECKRKWYAVTAEYENYRRRTKHSRRSVIKRAETTSWRRCSR